MVDEPGLAIHASRCVLHTQREAAARCPECKRFFCRECITEHDGRVLCSGCLAEQGQDQKESRRDTEKLRMTAQLIVALLILMMMFLSVGIIIQILPEDVDFSLEFREQPEL